MTFPSGRWPDRVLKSDAVNALTLLTQLGTFHIIGLVGTVGDSAWYLAYGWSRTEGSSTTQMPVNRWREE